MLALGLANVINIFDPCLIILSGERMQIDAPLPEIQVRTWGDLMWGKGAAAFAMDEITDMALREMGDMRNNPILWAVLAGPLAAQPAPIRWTTAFSATGEAGQSLPAPARRSAIEQRSPLLHGGRQPAALDDGTDADGWKTRTLWGMGIASRDISGDGRPSTRCPCPAHISSVWKYPGGIAGAARRFQRGGLAPLPQPAVFRSL